MVVQDLPGTGDPVGAPHPATDLTSGGLDNYVPRSGLSIPLVTIFDAQGRVSEGEQRATVRFALQDGAGADVLFAVGTTGEWDRIDNARRQHAADVILNECRRLPMHGKPVEAWVGVTAHTRHETLENLEFAIRIGASAAVIAPLSIRDIDDIVDLVSRDVAEVFQRVGRALPVFLYDNAEIAAAGKAPHMRTRDVKLMSQLAYVRGIKVTADKSVLGNYTRAASHFKLAHEFAIYVGNPLLIFDLFAPPAGLAGTVRHYWNRYLTQRSLPSGVVAGAANPMPREWQRGWQVCRAQDGHLMARHRQVLADFRDACVFTRAGRPFAPVLACLKAALAELGVVRSEALAQGTPPLEPQERREFGRRFRELRARCAAGALEPNWMSEYHHGRLDIARRHG